MVGIGDLAGDGACDAALLGGGSLGDGVGKLYVSFPVLYSIVCVGIANSDLSFSCSLSLGFAAEWADVAVLGLEKLRRRSTACCLSEVFGRSCPCLSAVFGRSAPLCAVLGRSCEEADFWRSASGVVVLLTLRSAIAESFLTALLLFFSCPICDLERVRPMVENVAG